MWYPGKVTVPPAAEPVTAAMAKRQCGIFTTDTSRDDDVALLVEAGRAWVESYCTIKLVTQTIEMKCDRFCDLARLPTAPLQSISAITYIDSAGATSTLDPSIYEARLDGLEPSIALNCAKAWPVPRPGSRITVTAIAGYGLAAAVPADIRHAILLFIGKAASIGGRDMLIRSVEVEGITKKQFGGIVEVSAAMDRAAERVLANYQRWPLR